MSVYDEQAKRFSSLRCEEHDLRSQIITDWELGSNAQRHIQARLVVVAEMNLLASSLNHSPNNPGVEFAPPVWP